MKNKVNKITTAYNAIGQGMAIVINRTNGHCKAYKYTDKNALNIGGIIDRNRSKFASEYYKYRIIDTVKG